MARAVDRNFLVCVCWISSRFWGEDIQQSIYALFLIAFCVYFIFSRSSLIRSTMLKPFVVLFEIAFFSTRWLLLPKLARTMEEDKVSTTLKQESSIKTWSIASKLRRTLSQIYSNTQQKLLERAQNQSETNHKYIGQKFS